MQLREITKRQMMIFLRKHPYSNFVQSPANTARLARAGWGTQLLGFYRGEKLIGAASTIAWKTPLGYEYECLQGPVVDYDDTSLVTEVLVALRQHVAHLGGVSLRIQPPVIMATGCRDTDMMPDATGQRAAEAIYRAGFRRVPTRLTDVGDRFQRWFYTKDLTVQPNEERLLACYSSRARRGVRSALKYGVEITAITDESQLDSFSFLMLATGDRRQFNARDTDFYQQFFKSFTRDEAYFLIAEIDAGRFIAMTKEELQETEKALAQAKTDAQLRKLTDQRAGLERRLAMIDQDTKRIALASGIFMKIGPDFIYFLGGSDKRYAFLNAPYLLQHRAMCLGIDLGARRYDFYGTNGQFNGKANQEGVYKFKLGFHGRLERRAACYEFVMQPMRHKMLKLLRSIRSRLR